MSLVITETLHFLCCFVRFDLELELTCYHDNERQDVCNWPAAVSVHVNNEPMPIDRVSWSMNIVIRLSISVVLIQSMPYTLVHLSVCLCVCVSVQGMGKSSLHRPLHIKRVCVPGRNFVGISSSQCCCVSVLGGEGEGWGGGGGGEGEGEGRGGVGGQRRERGGEGDRHSGCLIHAFLLSPVSPVYAPVGPPSLCEVCAPTTLAEETTPRGSVQGEE